MRKNSFKQKWNNFIKSGQEEEEQRHPGHLKQIIYVNTFSLVGITAFLSFGIVHLVFEKFYLGVLELLIGIAGIGNIIYLRKTSNYKKAGTTILLVMLLALTGLFINGGFGNTGIYWFYTFPLLAFFLKGKQGGIFWVAALYVSTLAVCFYFSYILYVPLKFSFVQIQQLFASLFAVSMLVYFYEKVIEKNEKTIQDSQKKMVEKILIEEEIKIAEQLQRSLLPQNNLVLDDIELVGFYKPSLGVSGDYYDFFQLNENEVAAVLCDVSGKGIPAAFVMVNIRAVFRALIKRNDENLQSIAHSLNHLMNNEVANGMFSTLFSFIYKRDSKEINFINAGHGPFTYYSSREKRMVEVEMLQVPLGIIPEMNLTEEINIKMNPGDIIVLFSDGITDSVDENNHDFGKNKLFDLIIRYKDLKANDICRAIIKEIKYYGKNTVQRDDISLIVAKIK